MNIVEAPQYIKHGTLKWISEQEIREHSIPLIVNPY